MIRTLLAIVGLLALYKWYVVPWLDWDSLTQTYPEAVPVQNLTEQIPSEGESPAASPQPSAMPTPPDSPSSTPDSPSPPSGSAPMPQPAQPNFPQTVPAEATPPAPPNSEDFRWSEQPTPEPMETFQWQGGNNI